MSALISLTSIVYAVTSIILICLDAVVLVVVMMGSRFPFVITLVVLLMIYNIGMLIIPFYDK